MAGVVVERESQGCSYCVTIVSGINLFFADIFFYIKYIPRSTAYYCEPQIKNLMIVMSLCWELLMGWRTSRLGLKLVRARRRILLCRPVSGSLSNCHNDAPKLSNFADKFGTHNSFKLVPPYRFHAHWGPPTRRGDNFLTEGSVLRYWNWFSWRSVKNFITN